RVLAIASGKGGVGKSNITVNLAIAAAHAGVRTVVIDGDFGLANADVLCGINSAVHIGQVIDGDRTLEQVAIPAPGGFRLVPGGSGVTRLSHLDRAQRTRLIGAVSSLASSTDLVIVDCGAGVGESVVSLVHAAHLAFVVTTPEPTAIADAYALIKVLARRGAQHAQLVVNQVRRRKEADAVHGRIAAVAARFLQQQVPLAGCVRFDEKVRAAVRQRQPFLLESPGSRAARDVRSLSGSTVRAVGLSEHAEGRKRRLSGSSRRAAGGFGRSPLDG
ncbi:MAG: MinD/ParA family protein, partial [Planctomycetota bacterium]